jgi:hypothetical protein
MRAVSFWLKTCFSPSLGSVRSFAKIDSLDRFYGFAAALTIQNVLRSTRFDNSPQITQVNHAFLCIALFVS